MIRWVKFSGAVWTRDGFYYSGYDEPKQSEALVAQNRFQKIFFHKLGTEQSADRLIYEDRAHPLRYVSAEVSKDDRHLFVFATEGTSGNEVLWADLSKGAPEFEVLFPGFANDYALVHARDGRAVFYTNEGAPRYRLVQADLNGAEPVLSELLPESELLLEGASVAGGSLFALYLDKAQRRRIAIRPLGQEVARFEAAGNRRGGRIRGQRPGAIHILLVLGVHSSGLDLPVRHRYGRVERVQNSRSEVRS